VALVNLEEVCLVKQVSMLEFFRVMGDNNISVSIISQGSSGGIGLVVAADKATTAMIELERNSKMISIRKMSIK
jgi:aspartokinase/homoserine dehydrogenase 1